MAPVIESGPCERTLQIDYDDEVAYHSIQGIYDLARSSDDKPFFLTVSFTHPHSPFVISQKYWDLKGMLSLFRKSLFLNQCPRKNSRYSEVTETLPIGA